MMMAISRLLMFGATLLRICLAAPLQIDEWTIEHFQIAREAQRNNNLELAAEEYRLIITRNPKFAEIYLNLGIVYHLQKKYGDSVWTLQTGLSMKPDMLGAQLFLGIGLYMTQDFEGALKCLERTLKMNPQEKQAGIYLALTYLALDQPEKAAKQLRRTGQYYPDDIEVLYHLGETYSEGMLQSSRLLRQTSRDSALYHWAVAISAERKADSSKAIQSYLKALAFDPNIAELYLRLSKLFEDEGVTDLAEAARKQFALLLPARTLIPIEDRQVSKLIFDQRNVYQQLWKALPAPRPERGLPNVANADVNRAVKEYLISNGHPDFRTALTLYERGEFKAAAEKLNRVRRQSGHWIPGYLLVRAHLATANYDAAEEALEDWVVPYLQLPSVALLRLEVQSELALRYFNLVVRKDPDSFRARILRAKSHAAAFRAEEAIAEYQEVLELRPDLPGVHLAIGQLYGDRLEWSRAIQEYTKELGLNPNNALALALLGQAYAEAREPDRSIQVLTRLLQKHPKDGKALADLGKAWATKGDVARAIDAYERSLICDGTQYDLHYRLFVLYRKTGESALAGKHLEAFRAGEAKAKARLPAINN